MYRLYNTMVLLNSIRLLEETDPTPTPMDSMLTDLGTVGEGIFGWVGEAIDVIVDNPILLLTTGFLVVGGAIGIFGRLLSKN